MKNRLRIHIRVDHGNSKLQEWTFDQPKKVSIGFSSQASVMLLDSDAGSSLDFFVRTGNEVRLRVLPKLNGFIEVDQKKISLQSLREAGLLPTDGKGDYIAVREKTAGSLVLGKTSIQFWVSKSPLEPEFPTHPIVIRFWSDVPWGTFVLGIVVGILEALLLIYIKSLPSTPPPTLQEVMRVYSRFELPEKDYVAERLRNEKMKGAGLTADASPPKETAGRPKSGPLPSKAQGFLSAVSKTNSGKSSSPFSSLFTSTSLSNEMEKALKTSGGFEKAMKESLKGFGGSGGGAGLGIGSAPQTVGIGSIHQETQKSGNLSKVATAPIQSRFSYEGVSGGGDFDRGALEKLVSSRSGELRDCYERALARTPSLAGKVTLRLILKPTGNPTIAADERSTIQDRSLHRCMIDRMYAWPFQKTPKPTDPILLPFIFSPASTRG